MQSRVQSISTPHIRMKPPSRSIYLAKKGILLQNHPCTYKSNESKRQKSDCYQLSESLLNSLDWNEAEERRWRQLFGKRIASVFNRSTKRDFPEVFPGSAISNIGAGSSQFERYQRILSTRGAKYAPNWEMTAISGASTHSRWPWLYVDKPLISVLNPDVMYTWLDPAPPRSKLLADKLPQLARSRNYSLDEIRSVLELVHCEWAKALNPFYDLKALSLCREILAQELHRDKYRSTPEAIELIFELEAYAFYSSILNRYKSIFTGEYQGLWLEIVLVPLAVMKPTELCQPDRLFDELRNLYLGRTAPVVINEHESVADGNHRLTAAWLWNLLNASVKTSWKIDDTAFQKAIADFIEGHKGEISPVTVHEVLRHLATILEDESRASFLEDQIKPWLRRHRMQSRIESLPAVVLTTYNGLAAIAESYDSRQEITRFEPGIYEALLNLKSKVLPPRACYHFADRVPLPWFALVEPNSSAQSEVQ